MKSIIIIIIVTLGLIGYIGLKVMNRRYTNELQLVYEASDTYATQAFYLGCLLGGGDEAKCQALTRKFVSGKMR